MTPRLSRARPVYQSVSPTGRTRTSVMPTRANSRPSSVTARGDSPAAQYKVGQGVGDEAVQRRDRGPIGLRPPLARQAHVGGEALHAGRTSRVFQTVALWSPGIGGLGATA